MKYIIDVEELSKICQSLDWGKDTPLEMMNMIRELLKSKQPVELVASSGYIFGGPKYSRNQKIWDSLSKLSNNNNIEIYVQKLEAK